MSSYQFSLLKLKKEEKMLRQKEKKTKEIYEWVLIFTMKAELSRVWNNVEYAVRITVIYGYIFKTVQKIFITVILSANSSKFQTRHFSAVRHILHDAILPYKYTCINNTHMLIT